jgi:hypothetical protein
MKKFKRVIQVELNELSKEVIDKLVEKGDLPTFAYINTHWNYVQTTSENDYEKLEPWIQWVTVHTGKTFDEHQVFRLSDVHKLAYPQTWEVLSGQGVESGIIGSMNVIRRQTQGGMFFPDPWAIQNDTYPESLKPLWNLISSRVQGHATSRIKPSEMLQGFRVSLDLGVSANVYLKMASQLVQQKLRPRSKWKLASVFDEFLAEIFLRLLDRTNYGFYTLFLNSVAHYQHHYWRAFDNTPFNPHIRYDDIESGDDPVSYGYKVYDRILSRILKKVGSDPDTLIVLVTGLSQEPYTHQDETGGMNYYRLNNHKEFAEKIGLTEKGFNIFPLMSRDWQVQYLTQTDREFGLQRLQELRVEGLPLFNVRENTEGFIFIETAYTRGVSDQTQITDAANRPLAVFKEVFTNIAIKSGHHNGLGNAWFSKPGLHAGKEENKIPLTDIFHITLDALGAQQPKDQADQALIELEQHG